MAAPEQVPATLAQLIRRRTNAGRASEPPPVSPSQVDSLGQFGLLFTEPEPEDAAAAASPAKPPERKLWGVAELVSALRGRVEREFAELWVVGEISNCRPAPSGHLYFTLKDGDAQLPAVLFRKQAILLRFRPEDGLSVLLRGRVSVYEGRGQLQLIAESLEPRGAGALQLAFEQLKEKLRLEGLFAAERKRALPQFPRTVGIITSLQGAVLRDIATVCRRRHARLNLLVFPATVQGPNSAAEVIRGLRYFNSAPAAHRVDLVLIARGGGSTEDLSGFNDESLARAIVASDLPVVSAIGHETDFSIADFVADLRAPTPSAAAEMITAAQHQVEERVGLLRGRLLRAMRFQQMRAEGMFTRLGAASVFARMEDSLHRRAQRLDAARFALNNAAATRLDAGLAQIASLRSRLERQDVRRRVSVLQTERQHLQQRLQRAAMSTTGPARQRLAQAEARLRALSPTAILQRGYALVYREDGSLLRDASAVTAGDTITARVASGSVRATVTAPNAAQE